MGFTIGNLTRLPLGWQGESNARLIDIDMSEWMRDWPNATVDMLVQRPGEEEYSPVDVTLQGGHLLWKPTRADVLIAGTGRAQIVLTDANDVELRTRVVETIIGESMKGTEGEAPDPVQGWLHEVLQAAQDARDAVDKMPRIGENGTWLVWDAEIGAHVDSGVKAEGRDGDKGDRGAMITNVYVKEKPIYNGQGGRRYYLIDVDGVPTYGFEVYDGLKGEKGDTGPKGDGVYVVTVTRDENGRPRTDITQAEIREAISQGQTCVLMLDGRIYTYKGEMYDSISREDTPTFVAPAVYDKTADMIYYPRAHVLSTQYVSMLSSTFPLPTGPDMRLESNQYGMPQWVSKDSDKILLSETVLTPSNAGGGEYSLLTPWEGDFVSGGVYKVTYNGTPYECGAVGRAENGTNLYLLGNYALLGETGGNADAPFVLIAIDNASAADSGVYAMFVATDGAESATLAVKQLSAPSASAKQHTITIKDDGTVNSTATFEELAAMTDAQIQQTVTVVEYTMIGAASVTHTSSIDLVTRTSSAEADYAWLQLRFGKPVDFSDALYAQAVTRYIEWQKGGSPTLSSRYTESLPHMTHWDRGTAYMRYNGSKWEPVGIDQLKEDLGLT